MTTAEPSASAAAAFSAAGTPAPDGRRIGVLLSHGFTGSPVSMRPWAEHLAAEGYAVELPLLPGHGTTWQEMVPTRYDDYLAEIERTYTDLASRCDAVVVGGLSMGGTLALDLAERHPEIAGLVLVNAAVASTNRQLLLLPVLKHVVKAFPAIGGDIKKEGVTESAYDHTPLQALHSLVRAWREVRAGLGRIHCPVLLFRSIQDHVVDPSSARIILAGLGSADVSERVLADSYHVATLDNDAEQIFTESAAFIARITRERVAGDV